MKNTNLKKLSLTGLLIAGWIMVHASVVTYTPDNTTIFKNPERGFTEELNGKVTESNPYRVKNHISSNWGQKDYMTMPVVLYNFNSYKSKDLPQAVLNGFDEDMQVLRSMGLKCVLRFAYTERESDMVDAKPDWVKKHLEQLKPYLAKNADVIYVLEAGFVGVWGEWYYTSNYGNESQHMNTNRRKVIQYLFDNAPEDRFILFRYPMLKTEYFSSSAALTAEEAFTGTMRARWGCHNDAFLHDWGNMGTYASDDEDDDPQVRQFIATETLYVPNGGETNIDDDDALAKKRYKDAPSEMSKYHWSFCGSTYATPVTNRWRSSGLFDTLNIHMGYRYNLVEGQYSDEVAPQGKMNVTIRVRNDGYAPIYNKRTAYIVLKGLETYVLPLKADPRRWLPNGVVSAINEQVDIPKEAKEGRYQMYLWLPDYYESIKNDPRYAVRLANKDLWDSETGMNKLNASVTISKSAPQDPGSLPELPPTEDIPQLSEEQLTKPCKIIENGIFYILMPNGKKYYCF